MWFLEYNNLLSEWQCGARKHRSTIDQLVRLDTFIREAFAKMQHAVAVFFDVEKAYDTAWKQGVLRDLHNMGLRGNLLAFISNYLTDRKFRVRIGATFSDSFIQEQGFPQGGVLAVILFLIRANKITEQPLPDVFQSLFVDDFNTVYAADRMCTIER